MALECVEGWKDVHCGMLKQRRVLEGGFGLGMREAAAERCWRAGRVLEDWARAHLGGLG
jgi:hypothetical protein